MAQTICSIDGCGRKVRAKGLCTTHYQRLVNHGDPQADIPIRPSNQITYSVAHKRIRRHRGPAEAHACVDCGEDAAHWSYTGGAPDELIELDHLTRTKVSTLRYSPNPEFYEPRCVTCHMRADRGQPAEEAERRLDERTPRTHCYRGHLLTPENTRVEPDGYRRCRTCIKDRRDSRALVGFHPPRRRGGEVRLIICDVCGTEERSRSYDYLGKDATWIVVEANEDADHAQLCSWSCLTTWALAKATEREGYALVPVRSPEVST